MKKRDSLKKRMDGIQAFFESLYDMEMITDRRKVSDNQLETKRKAAASYWEQYEGVFEELSLIAKGEQIDEIDEAYQEFQNLYGDIENMHAKIMATLFPPVKTEPTADKPDVTDVVKDLVASNNDLVASIKDLVNTKKQASDKSRTEETARLPKLDLKSFSGGYTQWHEFFDIFVCAVHNRENLAPVQKLQYLKSCLQGEALTLVKNLTLRDENYKLAIKVLKRRYDNIKTIGDAHFQTIFGLFTLQSQQAAGIRKLTARMYENVQAMQNLKEPVDKWDSWLIYVLKMKLDPETRLEWERHCTEDHPKFEDMVTFLNGFANAMELSEKPVKCKRPTDDNVRQQRTLHSNSSSAVVQCFLCDEKHRLPQCDQFLALTPEERKAKVQDLKLCLNCYSRKHFISSCDKPNSCKQCGGKHHPTLHFPKPSTSMTSQVQSSDESEILLSAAVVHVRTPIGFKPCRALLDSGSQTSFVTSGFVQRARLKGISRESITSYWYRRCT